LSGIPGSVGATPIQNVGAYGQEVADTVVRVRAYDRQTQRFVEFSKEECGFRYRDSFFKSEAPGRFLVVSVTYALEADGAPSLRYAVLEDRFSGATPSLAEVRAFVLETRREKSMVLDAASLDAGDPNARSCGSFFVNPVVDAATLEHIERVAGVAPPHHVLSEGAFKVPAAWLIERSGFEKGQRDGAVGLSTKHSLALVCHEGATARDVARFAGRVRSEVLSRFATALTPEPNFLGFERLENRLPIQSD
jgi:UDP-N-acetylmuramate dehydrogenase